VGVLLIVGAPRSVPGGGFGWAIGMVLLAAFIRGGAQPVVKLGLERWPSPFAASLIGYVISASMILGAGVVREGAGMLPFRTPGWAWFIPVGWLNGAALLAIYAALARGPVALVAPLVACYPLATLAFSRLLLGSGGLTLGAGLGVAITVAGVALLLRA
jgi:drug/metabolite transporter (DMT)-like permease